LCKILQVGSYVPAKQATFRVCDRIFSRIGFDDNLEGNASTLMVEVRKQDFFCSREGSTIKHVHF